MRSLAEAKAAFTAQKLDQGQTMRLLKIEKMFQSNAEDIFDLVPDSPDRTAGLRLLLQAKWTLAHAVSHGAPTIAPPPLEKKNEKKSKDAEAAQKDA